MHVAVRGDKRQAGPAVALGSIILLLGGLCCSEIIGRDRPVHPGRNGQTKNVFKKLLVFSWLLCGPLLCKCLVHWQVPSVNGSNDDLN